MAGRLVPCGTCAPCDGGDGSAGRSASLALEDASGCVALSAIEPVAESREPVEGDLVSGSLAFALGSSGNQREKASRLIDARMHVRPRSTSPDPQLAERWGVLERRAAMRAEAGAWFRNAGFLELETPTRVVCPGLEPHLRAFPSGDRWLITSPELHLKRALAAGAEKIVEFARAFRDDEHGSWHRSEFTMLEWYRAWAPLSAIEVDGEGLIRTLAAHAGVTTLRGAALEGPFERTTVRAKVLEVCDLDLAAFAACFAAGADVSRTDDAARDLDALSEAVAGRGHAVAPDDDADAIFFRLWLAEVEPSLGHQKPVFVHGYPASQAALARTGTDEDGFPVARRFELYAGGLELANAFEELNDPDEQRRRHQADRAARIAADVAAPPLDESFLQALEFGMAPACGIALGFDRLVAALLGLDGLNPLLPFDDP